MVTIHFYYMEETSVKILLNISFCDLQKNYYYKGLKWMRVSKNTFLNQLYL